MSRYKFIKLLGEGSFGKAYLCQNIQDNSQCVIKQIVLDELDAEEKKETLNEVAILKRLDHSNIIKFKDVFTKTKPHNTLNIVMEYADGGDLSKKIQKQREKKSPFTEKEIINYLTQICLALNHIHKKKIIHRDLKSGNIFLTKSGLVKLGDFGIAKGFKNTWEKAKTKVGTPYYLSPEIINSKPYDSKSDIWALGVLLYEMMTFKMPFNASSLPSLSLKIIKGYYPSPPTSYSKDLIDLVKKCLNLDPKKRPSVENILRLPFIKKRIFGYLDEVQFNEDLSITIIKKYKEKKENEKKRRQNIMINKRNENNNIRQSQKKLTNDTNIEKSEKNYLSDKNKVMKFFQKRNSANNNNNNISNKPKEEISKKKEINISQKYKIVNNENKNDKNIKNVKNNEEKKEPINFLKANKINIKNIKIVDSPKEKEQKDSHPHFQNMYQEEKTINEGLNDLINDYMDDDFNLNKINEDQYNQIRYLNNLSKFIKDEKQNCDEEESETQSLNKIIEESIQNENESLNFDEININVENSKISDNNIKKDELNNNEYKEIQELKNQLIRELGNDIFKIVYKHVDDSTDKTEIKFNMELLVQKLSKEFENNNKYNKKKINYAIEKLPEIFAIVIQDRLLK